LTQAVLSAERAGRARTTRAPPSGASSDAFPPRGVRTADRRGRRALDLPIIKLVRRMTYFDLDPKLVPEIVEPIEVRPRAP
jgi:hypothetical protein